MPTEEDGVEGMADPPPLIIKDDILLSPKPPQQHSEVVKAQAEAARVRL